MYTVIGLRMIGNRHILIVPTFAMPCIFARRHPVEHQVALNFGFCGSRQLRGTGIMAGTVCHMSVYGCCALLPPRAETETHPLDHLIHHCFQCLVAFQLAAEFHLRYFVSMLIDGVNHMIQIRWTIQIQAWEVAGHSVRVSQLVENVMRRRAGPDFRQLRSADQPTSPSFANGNVIWSRGFSRVAAAQMGTRVGPSGVVCN